MNYYSFIACLLLGLFFLYTGLDWLGLIFLALSIAVILYNPAKKNFNTAIEQAKKADGSVPDAKWGEYLATGPKMVADYAFAKPNTQYNSKDWLHKTPNMAKNFFSELDKIFK